MDSMQAPGQQAARWTAAELARDERWIYRLLPGDAAALLAAVRRAQVPGKPLLEYRRADFDLGPARAVIAAAFEEQRSGRGLALLKGLPREGVSLQEFELLTWAIGLHFGVARPQGKASQYISAVRDAGTTYRSTTGRGYSSNAGLDFHIDGADVAVLTCYNTAKAGGMSMVTSSLSAHDALAAERPDLLAELYQPLCFSRQGEQAPGEGAFLRCPMFAERDGRLFARINRNRLASAQQLEGVAPFTPQQQEALELVEEIVRRPELMFSMWLEAGDMQLLNNHVVVHSRTAFEDHPEPERQRLLYRLWLAPPDSYALPESMAEAMKAVAPGAVRGGIRGFEWDEARRAYERRQAADLGMVLPAA